MIRFKPEKSEPLLFHLGVFETIKNPSLNFMTSKDKDVKGLQLEILIQAAYGVRSENGKFFEKSQELTEAFIQTPQYSELLSKLESEDDYRRFFIRNIFGEPA